jgi:hypothetical protein
MVGLTAMAAKLDEEAHAGLMMRLAAACSWRRPAGLSKRNEEQAVQCSSG